MEKTLEMLQNVPLFALLPDSFFKLLWERGQLIQIPKEKIIFREGDQSDDLYFVLEGSVSVLISGDDGTQVQITRLKAGDYFGEMALLEKKPRSATTSTLTDCKLFQLGSEAFLDAVMKEGSTKALLHMLSVLSSNVRKVNDQYFSETLKRHMLKAEMEVERHRDLTGMVAGIAHELHTPLGIANTAVSVIKDRLEHKRLKAAGQADPKVESLLNDIAEAATLTERNILRAANLIKSFKQLSVNNLSSAREETNLTFLIQSILQLHGASGKTTKLDIHLQNDLSPEEQIWNGYPELFTQVLMNLLTNAERYAYGNSASGRVDIHLSMDVKEPNMFVLVFRDYGKGIDPEHLSKVFDPLFTTGRKVGGSGLGLAIVSRIVKQVLGGTINVASQMDEGTTFTLHFPRESLGNAN